MRKKTYTGNIPDLSKWNFFAAIGRGKWAVFTKEGSGGWINIKVSSCNPVKDKANYYLAWNGDRFANSESYSSFSIHRKELMQELMHLINAEASCKS